MHVSQLYIYPLKSARGIAVDKFELGSRGPMFDRQWMVVNSQGKFVTQRQFPRMCLIETRIHAGDLTLSAPQMPAILVGSSSRQYDVIVWKDTVPAQDCGDDVAQWLSSYLGASVRLVEMPSSSQRLVDSDYASAGEMVGFADGFPLLLASQASLDDFNTKLEDPIGMERFRPNIVIEGSLAYAEDEWQELSIGSIALSIVKPCSRCIIPSIDQSTAQKQMSVNDALLAHRSRNRKTYFGQNALHRNTGIISVGDSLSVL